VICDPKTGAAVAEPVVRAADGAADGDAAARVRLAAVLSGDAEVEPCAEGVGPEPLGSVLVAVLAAVLVAVPPAEVPPSGLLGCAESLDVGDGMSDACRVAVVQAARTTGSVAARAIIDVRRGRERVRVREPARRRRRCIGPA
jgi:hypothetical protein